jgi:hypothetical protein
MVGLESGEGRLLRPDVAVGARGEGVLAQPVEDPGRAVEGVAGGGVDRGVDLGGGGVECLLLALVRQVAAGERGDDRLTERFECGVDLLEQAGDGAPRGRVWANPTGRVPVSRALSRAPSTVSITRPVRDR